MNEKVRSGLRDDLIHVINNQVRRYDEATRRPDASGFESYGKLKRHLEKLTEAVKPVEKTLKEYWKQVGAGDEDLQGAYLKELSGEIDTALMELVCFAADTSRAMWSMGPYAHQGMGQMSMDEDYEVDEATGEILDSEEDLPPAYEVMGYEE